MKAAIINSVAKQFSTGKIAYGLYQYARAQGAECRVFYGRGEEYLSEPDLIKIDTRLEVYMHAILTRLSGLQGCFSVRATKSLLIKLDNFSPDVVFLLNLHGYYLHEFKLLTYLKRRNIRTVYAMMDEYPFTGKCGYSFECDKFMSECGHCPKVREYPKSLILDCSNKLWRAKKDAYNGFEKVTFASVPYVVDKASLSSLLKDKMLVKIDTGVDLDFFYPRETASLCEKLCIPPGHKIALCVAPLSNQRKGATYFLHAARICSQIGDRIIFVHVGFDGDKSICPPNYIPISYVSDQDELAAYYSMADLLMCTSLADAMPNVCLEALGCGTPICGFDISGTPYVASNEFGTFVPPKDAIALANAIRATPKKTPERSKACQAYALRRYSQKDYFKVLWEIAESSV